MTRRGLVAAALALWLPRASVQPSRTGYRCHVWEPSLEQSDVSVRSARLGVSVTGRCELISWWGFGESRVLVAGRWLQRLRCSCRGSCVADSELLPDAGDPLVGLPASTHEAPFISTNRIVSSLLAQRQLGQGRDPILSHPSGRLASGSRLQPDAATQLVVANDGWLE